MESSGIPQAQRPGQTEHDTNSQPLPNPPVCATQEKHKSNLHRLPAELRNKIYSYVLHSIKPYNVYFDTDSQGQESSFRQTPFLLPLALVCRMTLKEVPSMHLAESTFELFDMSRTSLSNGQTARDILDGMRQEKARGLRQITVKYRDDGIFPVTLHASWDEEKKFKDGELKKKKFINVKIIYEAEEYYHGDSIPTPTDGCIARLQEQLIKCKTGDEPPDGRALVSLAKEFCMRYFNVDFGNPGRCRRCNGRLICTLERQTGQIVGRSSAATRGCER